jgi:triosephosphate isomerase
MDDTPRRKPLAVANWKMAMTIAESLAFGEAFLEAAGELAASMTVVLCPPYTALYPLSQALVDSPIELGAQNLCAGPGNTHTGEISAPLLVDAGCQWVLLGHWEVLRGTGESDKEINAKMHAAFEAGLRSILLIGERAGEGHGAREALTARLSGLFSGCHAGQVAQTAIIYEPERTIGAREPIPPDLVAGGCSLIRDWLTRAYGMGVAESVRIIYGGSVAPENATKLLASSEVDGLGAGRKGRDPQAFAEIVHAIAGAKGLA